MTKVNFPPDPQLYRQTLIDLAGSLVGKASFSKEDGARAALALNLSHELGTMSSEPRPGAEQRVRDYESLNAVLRTRNGYLFGRRELTISDPTIAPDVSVFAAALYFRQLTVMLATIDPLLNPDVVTLVTTDRGAAMPLPAVNALDSAAQVDPEGALDLTDSKTVISAVPLATAPTWRTPMTLASREFVEDTAFPLSEVLLRTHSLQFGLSIGPSLIRSLLSAAVTGATASGSSASTGVDTQTGANSVGWQDLISLRTSVQAAYRQGKRCGWLMTDDTLSSLDSQLDKSGRPVFPQAYDENSRRLLQGFPVFVAPSMPAISAGSTPVAFGNMSYFLTRLVKESIVIRVLRERYAIQGQVGFFAKLRANGALLGCGTWGSPAQADSPIKLLQMAAE